MQIRTVAVSQLKPAPYNPRIPLEPGSPGYRRLERSLDEFSLVEPIVWNEQTGHVVAGHQRLEILKNQGAEEIEVSVVSLPLEREKALNVALNNRQVGSDWDPEKLVDVLTELSELDDFDATLTGFDEDHLNDLLLGASIPPGAAGGLCGDTASDDGAHKGHVEVRIEIARETWETVRPALDEIIAAHNLAVHVRMNDGR